MMPLQILSFDALEIIPSPCTTIQMGNLSKTFLIYIYVKTGIMDNIQVGVDCNLEEIVSFSYPFKDFRDVFPWYYEEMHGIDPSIFKHEINKFQTFFYGIFLAR